jgi:hypothetical protein
MPMIFSVVSAMVFAPFGSGIRLRAAASGHPALGCILYSAPAGDGIVCCYRDLNFCFLTS